MMVPRSFRYSAAPPMESLDEKKGLRKSTLPKNQITSAPRRISPARTVTEPVRMPTQPISVPRPDSIHSTEPQRTPVPNATKKVAPRMSMPSNHDPNALPPAVAALLAYTEIPRPRRGQFQRRRSANPRRMSLDQLVNEWRSDESLTSSDGSSPALSVLLEDPHVVEEPCATVAESAPEESLLCMRSLSAESVPSLEADDRSTLSNESLSTPESLRSRKSTTNLRKEKLSRSLPVTEECDENHPLAVDLASNEDPDDAFTQSVSNSSRPMPPKTKASFKSNLTSSLQALKNAAISSLSSLTSNNSTADQRPDDTLWSHPYLFPRLSPEVRPAISGKPTKAQRRYLNPTPQTFEELEIPYQLALHAPFLAEEVAPTPTIQLQAYGRAKRKSSTKRGAGPAPDPDSELGRALLGIRQREPRENPDFMRAFVCEWNMRRSGKLRYGKAKMWLPPRQVGWPTTEPPCEKVPRRWRGESAY